MADLDLLSAQLQLSLLKQMWNQTLAFYPARNSQDRLSENVETQNQQA
jgi:hypothetical protein